MSPPAGSAEKKACSRASSYRRHHGWVYHVVGLLFLFLFSSVPLALYWTSSPRCSMGRIPSGVSLSSPIRFTLFTEALSSPPLTHSPQTANNSAAASSESSSSTSTLPFSAEYLEEMRELEALERKAEDDDLDAPLTDYQRPSGTQKRFWGRKEERIDDLAFVLSTGFSPMSDMFQSRARWREKMELLGLAVDDDDDDDDDAESNDEPHEFVFPMVFGNTFQLEREDRYSPYRRRRARRSPFLKEAEEETERSAGPPAGWGGSDGIRTGSPAHTTAPSVQGAGSRDPVKAQRARLRKERLRARERPQENGCWMLAVELLHRIKKVRPMVEEAYLDALHRSTELGYNLTALRNSIYQRYPAPAPGAPSVSSTEENQLFEEEKWKATLDTPTLIKLQQMEITIRHATHKLKTAETGLKEFDERTWKGIGAKLAPKCLGEAARYRFYLLHRELPSMTLAPLPPPLIFSDDDEDDVVDEDEEDLENTSGGEEGGDEIQKKWIKEEEEEEFEELMQEEKSILKQRLRAWMEEEKRTRKLKNANTSQNVSHSTEEEEDDEEELEEQANVQYKSYLVARVRDRQRAQKEARQRKEQEAKEARRRRQQQRKKGTASSEDVDDTRTTTRSKGSAVLQRDIPHTATRSRKQINPAVMTRPLKEERFMSLTEVVQQCKTFMRNRIYGVVLPPYYVLWQLLSAVIQFYWEEWKATAVPESVREVGPQGIKEWGQLIVQHWSRFLWKTTEESTISVDAHHQLCTEKTHTREGMDGDPDLEEAPFSTVEQPSSPPPTPVTSRCSNTAPTSNLFVSSSAREHLAVIWGWAAGMALLVGGLMIGPLVVFFLFFRDFVFQLVVYRFLVQYLFHLHEDPVPVLNDIFGTQLLRYHSPFQAYATWMAWYQPEKEQFLSYGGGFRRWWYQVEPFLAMCCVLALIPPIWLIWKVCRKGLSVLVFWESSVITEEREEVQKEKPTQRSRDKKKKKKNSLPEVSQEKVELSPHKKEMYAPELSKKIK